MEQSWIKKVSRNIKEYTKSSLRFGCLFSTKNVKFLQNLLDFLIKEYIIKVFHIRQFMYCIINILTPNKGGESV